MPAELLSGGNEGEVKLLGSRSIQGLIFELWQVVNACPSAGVSLAKYICTEDLDQGSIIRSEFRHSRVNDLFNHLELVNDKNLTNDLDLTNDTDLVNDKNIDNDENIDNDKNIDNDMDLANDMDLVNDEIPVDEEMDTKETGQRVGCYLGLRCSFTVLDD